MCQTVRWLLFAAALAIPAGGRAAAPAAKACPPWEAIKLVHADATALPKDQCFFRYFWRPEGWTEDYLRLASMHFALLSDQNLLPAAVLVSPHILRLDVRRVGWDRRLEVWEKLARFDFVFHSKAVALQDLKQAVVWPGGIEGDGKFYKAGTYAVNRKKGDRFVIAARWLPQKETDELRALLQTETPIVWFDWFFVQTARQTSLRNDDNPGCGYYDFLGLKNRAAFFRFIGLNEKEAIRLYQQWREAVRKSGVSQQNRIIDWKNAITGRAIVTLDTFVEKGRGIAARNLRDGELAHDAEEWYGFTPFGIMVHFLSDAKGNRIASAPDKIGPDDSALRIGRDGRIHVNLSCIRCHGPKDMLMPVRGYARRIFRHGGIIKLQDPDEKVTQELEAQYLSDLEWILDRDRAKYTRAVARVTSLRPGDPGLSCTKATLLYGRAWNEYVERDVTAASFALSLGVSEEKLLEGIRRNTVAMKPGGKKVGGRGGGDLVLAVLIDDPADTLTRLEAEDSYALAMVWALGLAPPEAIEKVKALP